jgi:Flp pilus assembly protein TadG
MRSVAALRRSQDGVAVIEMAIALPVLVMFIWGIFQIGIAFQANAGMHHALGEGARLATLCLNPDPDTGCEVPTNDQIIAKINQKVFGPNIGTFGTPTITEDPDDPSYKELRVTFTMPLDFLFFQGPNVSLSQTKKVYIAS